MEVRIQIINLSKPMTLECKQCRRILERGQWVIGLYATERLLLRRDPPLVCCGETKVGPAIFSCQGVAETIRDCVVHCFSHRSRALRTILTCPMQSFLPE
jgi:hypothetical protein